MKVFFKESRKSLATSLNIVKDNLHLLLPVSIV